MVIVEDDVLAFLFWWCDTAVANFTTLFLQPPPSASAVQCTSMSTPPPFIATAHIIQHPKGSRNLMSFAEIHKDIAVLIFGGSGRCR